MYTQQSIITTCTYVPCQWKVDLDVASFPIMPVMFGRVVLLSCLIFGVHVLTIFGMVVMMFMLSIIMLLPFIMMLTFLHTMMIRVLMIMVVMMMIRVMMMMLQNTNTS